MALLIIERIVCLVIGYAFGLFQTSYFIGKSKNIDIREHGSGNAGSTNALRTMGTSAGLMTFGGDLVKGLVCVFLVKMLFGIQHPELRLIFGIYAALGVAIGHDFPFYLNFKGGKGVACTFGAMIAIDWRLGILPLLVFLMIVFFTRFVSLGSITGVTVYFVETILFTSMGGLDVADGHHLEFYLITLLITGLCIFQHRSNIKRLKDGEERRIEF